jgi:2-oxoglutarate ferredoxin oxidoreductase subunit delta
MAESLGPKRGKGTVFVSIEICKGCSYCIDFCPSHCLDFSNELNAKGYHFPVLARPEDCSGCDLCGLYCPDFAIFGVRFRDLEKRAAAAAPDPMIQKEG